MISKLQKLRRKKLEGQPELRNGYKVYAWVWLVLSLNWVAWVLQTAFTAKTITWPFALPGVLVAALAIWLLRCKPENRRTAITAIGGTTTLFLLANVFVAAACLLAMALALRSRKA